VVSRLSAKFKSGLKTLQNLPLLASSFVAEVNLIYYEWSNKIPEAVLQKLIGEIWKSMQRAGC